MLEDRYGRLFKNFPENKISCVLRNLFYFFYYRNCFIICSAL